MYPGTEMQNIKRRNENNMKGAKQQKQKKTPLFFTS
jgi:hypothetical protein